jgi:hypothetical protein
LLGNVLIALVQNSYKNIVADDQLWHTRLKISLIAETMGLRWMRNNGWGIRNLFCTKARKIGVYSHDLTYDKKPDEIGTHLILVLPKDKCTQNTVVEMRNMLMQNNLHVLRCFEREAQAYSKTIDTLESFNVGMLRNIESINTHIGATEKSFCTLSICDDTRYFETFKRERLTLKINMYDKELLDLQQVVDDSSGSIKRALTSCANHQINAYQMKVVQEQLNTQI